ncbi:hypothetical protein I0Q12_24700 [Rhodococcus sp. CX]|nr:hypothetical protein [Rhodococcus sp. CX]MBH0122522.1 hypothetical protein [Rhodococcus sp. CX]
MGRTLLHRHLRGHPPTVGQNQIQAVQRAGDDARIGAPQQMQGIGENM